MNKDRNLYLAVIAVLVVLLVVMFVGWDYDRSSAAADEKAATLIDAYEAAGLRTPVDSDDVARLLGDDGGAVCAAAGNDQLGGFLKTQYGVGGEFYFRPVRVDERMVEGLVLIVQTYCPDKLPDVEDFIDDLNFSDVIRD